MNCVRASPFWLLFAAAFLIGGCSSGEEKKLPDSLPDDFLVVYEFREGSLPPPHYFEYTLTIARDGTGSVVMVPDYEFNSPPRWTESFMLDADAVARLYATLKEAGLASTNWKEPSNPPVGGRSGSLTVTASGEDFVVPAFVVSSQQELQQTLVNPVTTTVSDLVWGRLEAKRQQYIAEHSK